MKIKEMIVVEGRDDTAAIRRAVDADTIETRGSAIRSDVLDRIRLAHQKRGVIVLTDPDYQGERIRRIIRAAVPGCKHAFIPYEEALRNGKVGVEYASPMAIRAALAKAKAGILKAPKHPAITWEDIVSYGLTAHPAARRRREKIGHALGIGYANARGFYRRLLDFQVTPQQLRQAVQHLNEEERNGR